jgi:hypothetical protein
LNCERHINHQNTIVNPPLPQCSSYESIAHCSNKCSSKIQPQSFSQ